MGGQRNIVAGSYLFDQPESVFRIAVRTIRGIYDLDKIRITIFEGLDSREIGELLAKRVKSFGADEFSMLAKKYEGYLFPDTYFFYQDVTPEEVVDIMRESFNDKFKAVGDDVERFAKLQDKTEEEVVTMASIIEREAPRSEDRRLIAGILWKRIDVGMPLQVDPPFHYVLGNNKPLTLDNLKMVSPYNLYLNKGLTPTPIANPGLSAIVDTINPTKSPYWYFLADRKGIIRYAKTHDEHVENKLKYLR